MGTRGHARGTAAPAAPARLQSALPSSLQFSPRTLRPSPPHTPARPHPPPFSLGSPLFDWLASAVALCPDRRRLDGLPLQCRAGLLAVLAAFLPYYETPAGFRDALRDMPSPAHTAEAGGHAEGEGADLVLSEAADMLSLVKSEAALLQYLHALTGARGSPADPVRRNSGQGILGDPFALQGELEETGNDAAAIVVGLPRGPAEFKVSHEPGWGQV